MNFLDNRMPERFWNKCQPCPMSGCWIWTGSTTHDGYGTLTWRSRHGTLAHRVSFEEMAGAIPEGLEIDHLCRNRLCVNPNHLEPVTHAENLRRTSEHRARKTHCIHGHAFTPDNTGSDPRRPRRRRCLSCARRQTREWAESHKRGAA